MKKRGYLLIDISVGAAVISIFTLTIFSVFQGYLNLKGKIDNNNNSEYFLIKELDSNVNYEILINLSRDLYYIDLFNIEKNNIEDILNEEYMEGSLVLNIMDKNEIFVEYELTNNRDNSVGFIKYRSVE